MRSYRSKKRACTTPFTTPDTSKGCGAILYATIVGNEEVSVKRFPDIIVISWQCECGQYMTESIDISNVNVTLVCEKCRMSYTVAIGEIDVNVDVTARTRRERPPGPPVNSLSSQ